MNTVTSALPRITLTELALESDPYPEYERLRLAGPLARAGPNQWLLCRYREVAELLHDPSLKQFQISAALSRLPAQSPLRAVLNEPAVQFTERVLAARDADEHKEMRREIVRALKPLLTDLDPTILAELDPIIDMIRRRKCFDAVADVAFPLPVKVLGRLVGIPPSLQVEAGRCALTLTGVFLPGYDGTVRPEVNAAALWLRECISSLISSAPAAHPAFPGGDNFIARLQPLVLDRWDRADFIDNVIFMLFAGIETSLNLIANGFDALLDFPEQQRRLRAAPELMPLAVEEFLRYNSPVHVTARVTSERMQIAGQHISSGRILYLGLAGANRDESVFKNAHQLDVGRAPNRHLAFGAGAHYCLGATVARREAELTFGRILGELGWLERAAAGSRNQGAALRSLTHLDVGVAS